MQPTELSSNWKKLQKTLGKDTASKKQQHQQQRRGSNGETSASSPSLKRKASHIISRTSSQIDNKKQKTQNSRPNRKMGAYMSSHPMPNTTDTSATIKPRPITNGAASSTPSQPTPSDLGKYIALDCEMVGTTFLTPFSTPAHQQPPNQLLPEYSILARASLVSYTSAVIYDAYVLPPPDVDVTNYRTRHSGVTAAHLSAASGAKPFAQVQREVAALLDGRVLVGHALRNDLAVLGLGHPARDVRDSSRHGKFRRLVAGVGRDGRPGKGRTPSLKRLAREVLGWEIQGGGVGDDDGGVDGKERGTGIVGHDSVEDARAAMALFVKEREGFEVEVSKRYGRSDRRKTSTGKVVTKGGGRGTDEGLEGLGVASKADVDSEGDDVDDDEDVDENVGVTNDAAAAAAAATQSSSAPRKKLKKKKKKKAKTKR